MGKKGLQRSHFALDFSIDQSYYTVVLSFLLMHYYFDHFLFFSKEDELKPAYATAAVE